VRKFSSSDYKKFSLDDRVTRQFSSGKPREVAMVCCAATGGRAGGGTLKIRFSNIGQLMIKYIFMKCAAAGRYHLRWFVK